MTSSCVNIARFQVFKRALFIATQRVGAKDRNSSDTDTLTRPRPLLFARLVLGPAGQLARRDGYAQYTTSNSTTTTDPRS